MNREEVITQALEDIRAIYQRNRREFSDTTARHFLMVLGQIPTPVIPKVVAEYVVNPPQNGDYTRYVPEPADLVTVARRFSEDREVTPEEVMAEIIEKIARCGVYGRLVEGIDPVTGDSCQYLAAGAPPLSPAALETVGGMGGWVKLCQMESKDGVWQSQVRQVATAVLRREKDRPMVSISAIGGGLKLQLTEGGKK